MKQTEVAGLESHLVSPAAGLENLLKPPIAAVNTLPSSGQKNLRKPAIGAAANDPVRSEVRTETPVSSGTVTTQRAVSAQTLDAQNFGTQTGTHVTDAVTGGAGMSSLQPAQQSATPKQGVSTRKFAVGQGMHYAVVIDLE